MNESLRVAVMIRIIYINRSAKTYQVCIPVF